MTTIAEDLARLEEIVRKLEADDVELDAALALFEEGVARLRAARGARRGGPQGQRSSRSAERRSPAADMDALSGVRARFR